MPTDSPELAAHLLVTDTNASAVLLDPRPDGTLRLPRLDGVHSLEGHRPIADAVARALGRSHPVLRVLPVSLGPEDQDAVLLVVVERLASFDGLDGAPVGLDDARLQAVGEGLPEPVAVGFGRWLEELRTGEVDPRRQRWQVPGFQARARAWMRDRMQEAGTPVIGDPVVTTLWSISAMLEADTATGRVFMKACATVFDTEPAILAALDARVPGHVPAVVATDSTNGWVLMRDAGGSAVGDDPPDTWAAGLPALGAIQRVVGGSLEGVQLEDRGPQALAVQLPGLLDGPYVARFPDDLRAALRTALPRLVDACEQLASRSPSSTIVHGDFHPWNVHRDGDRVTIIDWSDAALGHPFTDLSTYLPRTADLSLRQTMLDAYLDGWRDGASGAGLAEAVIPALVAGSMHQVESYRRITESLEPDADWGLWRGGRSFARWALAWLDEGLEAAVPH